MITRYFTRIGTLYDIISAIFDMGYFKIYVSFSFVVRANKNDILLFGISTCKRTVHILE